MAEPKGYRQGQGGKGMTRSGARLTDREMRVLRLSADGKGVFTIARRLNISMVRVRRIKRHIKAVLSLPPSSNTDDMVVKARQMGFIE